jgi:hypothetical protein
MRYFMKLLLGGISICLILTTPVVAKSCDRVVYPLQQTLDLSKMDLLGVRQETCERLGYTIRCTNQKSGKAICFKCKSGGQWNLLRDSIYRCSGLKAY